MPAGANSYRLGWGEVVRPGGEQALARALFLRTVEQLYPACLDDLLELAVSGRWEGHWSQWQFEPAYESARAAVEAWARRWRLLDRGTVPAWLMQAALETLWLQRNSACPPRGFAYPGWGGPALVQDGERLVAAATQFDPELDRAAPVKRRLRARGGKAAAEACRRVDEIIKLALARGGKLSAWRCEPAHFEWAVRALVGRETYEIISRQPARVSPFAVRNAVQAVLSLVGLRRSRCAARN